MYIVHNCGRRLKTLLDREHGTVWQVLQYITVHYITVQYSTVVAGGGGGELQLQPRGRAAGAGRHRAQVSQNRTVLYSIVQLTVQYSTVHSTVCCRCTTVWRIGAAHLADLKHA